MKEKTHHCTITDSFVYSTDIRIDMVYTHIASKEWRCVTTLIGQGYGAEVVLNDCTLSHGDELGMMMKSQRCVIEELLMRLALLVAVKTRKEEL